MSLELDQLDSESYSSMEAEIYTAESGEEFNGVERRHSTRRIWIDRRRLVRFDFDKLDRRSDQDRRADGIIWGTLYG